MSCCMFLDKVWLKGKFYFCYEFLNLKKMNNLFYFIFVKEVSKKF
jgi:hypothetical protein